ncbi:MAG: spermidine synthase [Planctomycetota bacterium]|nr:spermidine synthase [Planctomycetota bacterium]
MSVGYQELDVRETALGTLILRRRRVPGLGDTDVYEIKLNDDLLMSSWLNESELQLSHLAIATLGDGPHEVLVGGLGLGYTAFAALTYEQVRRVTVVEFLPEVIEWHATSKVPLGAQLTTDPRCRIVCGDFFENVSGTGPALVEPPPGGYGAILVDIDHAPDQWLAREHARFYGGAPLEHVASLLAPGGVFALWSAGRENEGFTSLLGGVFAKVETHAIEVYNPMIDADQVDTIYVARE